MFIRLMSDLHLELNNPFVPPVLPEDAETVLVLAGDISTGLGPVGWIDSIKDRFKRVIFIAGNHEFYSDNLSELQEVLHRTYEEDDKVIFLNTAEVVVDGVRFLGGTLWTDFKGQTPSVMHAANVVMSDYSQIKNGPKWKRLTTADVLKEHNKTLGYIEARLAVPFQGETVVVTHHGPSYKSVHKKYWTSSMNYYFVSELDPIIERYQPKYWLHGHTHESMSYSIGNTKIITNPFGYYGYEVNENFNPNLLLEI